MKIVSLLSDLLAFELNNYMNPSIDSCDNINRNIPLNQSLNNITQICQLFINNILKNIHICCWKLQENNDIIISFNEKQTIFKIT